MVGAHTVMSQSGVRTLVARAERLVVKLGTAVLTGGSGELDRGVLHGVASEVRALREAGRDVLIVSSGAIGAGMGALGIGHRPRDVASLQASAAVGQPLLMSLWREAFAAQGLSVAQLLVGRDDFDARDRYLNIRNCVIRLHELGAVPILNENDTVATQELSLGDNDVLAARLAVAVQAHALIVLTTAPGVMDQSGAVVNEARDAESLRPLVRTDRTAQGRGGMGTKVEAARVAGLGGVATVIASGRPPSNLGAVARGEPVGTFVAGPARRIGGRRSWIALSATPMGRVTVDDGAARALVERNASLLARGVTGCEGSFEAGDVVEVVGPGGASLARGLVNFSSAELQRVVGRASEEFSAILGRDAHEEVVHRDNLAVG